MRGSLVPLVTPFHDGRIDDRALTDLVEWHIASGSDGVVMCGSTGEGASLSTEEREHVFSRLRIDTPPLGRPADA